MMIPITAMFLLRCETLAGWDGGRPVVGVASDDPQCMQKAELGGSSFPHLEQKGIGMTVPAWSARRFD